MVLLDITEIRVIWFWPNNRIHRIGIKKKPLKVTVILQMMENPDHSSLHAPTINPLGFEPADQFDEGSCASD